MRYFLYNLQVMYELHVFIFWYKKFIPNWYLLYKFKFEEVAMYSKVKKYKTGVLVKKTLIYSK